MEPTTLQYRGYVSEAGLQRIDDVLLLMGHLQNALIRHRYAATSSHRRSWNLKLQNAQLTDLHRQQPEYHACARRLLEATARRVNKSFSDFFNDNNHFGKPETKSPFRNRTLEISEPSVHHLKPGKPGWATVRIKGLPTIRFRTDQRLPANEQPKIIRITKLPKRIVVSLVFEQQPRELLAPIRESVGIDPGKRWLITAKSDDGTLLQIPGIDDSQHRKTKRRLLRKMQRQRDAAIKNGDARFVSQKTAQGVKRRFRWIQPSKNYLKTLAQLRRVEQTRQDSMRGFQHRLSTQIVKDHQVVCMEDTKTRNLTKSTKGTLESPGKNVAQKRALNRGILAQGWYGLRSKTKYKAGWYQREFVYVPAAYTSQRCSQCGHIEEANRKGEAFKCKSCGHPEQADANAAENIRCQGLAILARAGNQPGRATGSPSGNKRNHSPIGETALHV